MESKYLLKFLFIFLILFSSNSYSKTPKDQLIIGMSMNNIFTIDPAAMASNDTVSIISNLYDSLIELDATDRTKILPAIAKSWDISEDSSKITFHLRDDVKFNSGNPLTAEDVVWSIERLLKLNLSQSTFWKTYGFSAKNISQLVKSTDNFTIEITLPQATDPKLVMYSIGALGSMSILDKNEILKHEQDNDLGNKWLTTNAAGSGAYYLTKWEAKNMLIMARNEHYWKGTPKMKRIIMRHMTESQSLRLMMEKGDIDIASGMSVPDIKALSNNPNITIESVQRGTLYYVALSNKNKYFANPKVREAIRYLIDYQGINATIMPGFGILHQRPIQKGMPATLPDQGYTLNVEKAKKLLSEAGYPDGFDTTIRVLSDTPFIDIATTIQATLVQAGIKAKVIAGTGNQIYGAMRERNFDIVVGRGGGGVEPHPHANLRSMVYNPDNSDEAKLTPYIGWRSSFYDDKLNKMIETALIERNETKQTQLYKDIQNYYDELFPAVITISQMIDSVAVQKDILNYKSHPSATTRYYLVEKKR